MSEKIILASKKTRFNHFYVIQEGSIRELWFKGDKEYFLQSRINAEDSADMVMVYSKLMMAALFFQPQPKNVLIIGLGGLCFPDTSPTYILRFISTPSMWIHR